MAMVLQQFQKQHPFFQFPFGITIYNYNSLFNILQLVYGKIFHIVVIAHLLFHRSQGCRSKQKRHPCFEGMSFTEPAGSATRPESQWLFSSILKTYLSPLTTEEVYSTKQSSS